MTCPRCYTEFERDSAGACPECGVRLVRNVSGVMKTSAVMIAARGEHGFYHSVQDVPEPLRTQLIEVTNSPNSGTIVIADRAGKEQMTQAAARRDSASGAIAPPEQPPPPNSRQFLGVSWIAWLAALLLLTIGGIVTAALAIHW